MTSLAKINPATDGTNAVDPGIDFFVKFSSLSATYFSSEAWEG